MTSRDIATSNRLTWLSLRDTSVSLRHSPWREIRPRLQRLLRPVCRFVAMAHRTRIRNLQQLRIRGRNELEGMTADVHVGDLLFDLRHVARDAFVSGAARSVMGVRLDGGSMRTVRRFRTVAFQAKHARRLDQVSVVPGAVNVVTTE